MLLTKLKEPPSRLAYAQRAIQHGWSRNMLNIHIETRLLEREGNAVTNFEAQLPRPHSDLAHESLKDPYRLDFLGLGDDAHERAIEAAIVQHITQFLIELGAGFAYVGRQVHIEVGGDDFFIDLLFYHLKLRCYVVVELKAGAFKPEHAGQLNFYPRNRSWTCPSGLLAACLGRRDNAVVGWAKRSVPTDCFVGSD